MNAGAPETGLRNVSHVKAVGCILLVVSCSADAANEAPRSELCAGCATLEYVATIGGDADPASADTMFTSVARDGRGSTYVLASSLSEIMVYSPTGQYLRSIGGPGEGPGELVVARYVMTAGDSLLVFSGGRYTVYDSTGVAIGTTPLSMMARKAYLGNGDALVVQGEVQTRDGVGHPLHRIVNGEVVASFGADDEALVGREPDPVTAAAGGGLYWIVRPAAYRLELWSAGAGLVRAMDQQRPWFDWPQDPIKAYVADVWMAPGDSLVWTSVLHVHGATRGRPVGVSVVEAIDIRTGKVLVRDSLPGHRLMFTNDGHLFSAHEAESGNIVISLWRRISPASRPSDNVVQP